MTRGFEGMKAGRAFVSSGPLLEATFDGALPGDSVSLPAGGKRVSLSVRLRSITALASLELVCNGEELESFPIRRSGKSLDVEFEFDVTRSGWCHVRTEGEPANRAPLDVDYAQAFTNPVWFEVEGSALRNLRLGAIRTRLDRQTRDSRRRVAGLAIGARARACFWSVRTGA